MQSFREKGGMWVIIQNVLTLAVLVAGPLQHGSGWPQGARLAGWLIYAAGAVFGITGVRALGKNRTAFPTPVAEHRLVQSGVYGLVRHPLYTSLILLGLGWGLIWSSIVTLALTIVLTLVLDAKARLEERLLLERYSEYAAYKKRVSRLVPFLY